MAKKTPPLTFASLLFAVLSMGCDDSGQPYSGLSRVNSEAYLVISDDIKWFTMISMSDLHKHFCIGIYDDRGAVPRGDSDELISVIQANKPATLNGDFRPTTECTRNGAGDMTLPTGEPAIELFAVMKPHDDKYGNWLGGHGLQGPNGPGAYGSFFEVSTRWGKLHVEKLGGWNTGPNGEL